MVDYRETLKKILLCLMVYFHFSNDKVHLHSIMGTPKKKVYIKPFLLRVHIAITYY